MFDHNLRQKLFASLALVFLRAIKDYSSLPNKRTGPNRELEKVALKSKSRRGSRGSYAYFSVRLTKT